MGKYAVDYLKKIDLFFSLTDEELHKISHKIIIKYFKKNEIILYEEDTSQYMYMILKGKVKVFQTTKDGKEIFLALHKSGEFFGEMSLIDGKTSPATVMATEDSNVAIISKKDFYVSVGTQKKVLGNLLLILCSRLRESWETIQLLNLKNASDRIKILLFTLSNKYGEKTSKGITLNIRLTHQEIADMTGMTRETVTRVLDRWLRDGEINILDSRLIQLNTDFLQKDLKLS
jgi:CRP/FNR family cyclic AMP-dependent transcriptional regulator